MIRGHVFGVSLVEARAVDALAELLVAAGLEALVELAVGVSDARVASRV